MTRLFLLLSALLLVGCGPCAQFATRTMFSVCWTDAFNSSNCMYDIASYTIKDGCLYASNGRTRCGSFDVKSHQETYCYLAYPPNVPPPSHS